MYGVVEYNIEASCHPTALDFWGVNRKAPDFIYSSRDEKAKVYAYALLNFARLEFPKQIAGWSSLMEEVGLDPSISSTDLNSSIGLGTSIRNDLARRFSSDGWNTQGDLSRRHNRLPFLDYTSYAPVNSPIKQDKPLRWTPLTQRTSTTAKYATQVQVVPLAMSEEDVLTRRSKPLYNDPNGKIGYRDHSRVKRLLADLLETTVNLTEENRCSPFFWEDKTISLGGVSGFYAAALNFTRFEKARHFLAETIAIYDAILLA